LFTASNPHPLKDQLVALGTCHFQLGSKSVSFYHTNLITQSYRDKNTSQNQDNNKG